MTMYGYVRVSTRDQNEERQVLAMRAFGVPQESIVIEKASGKDFNRLAYKDLMHRLKPGDVLVIKSIDRLGRDYDDIIEEWRIITKEIKADIVVIDLPLLDTRNKEKDLTLAFISDVVLQILSYTAENERESSRQRQAEGIAAAKARGVKFGNQGLERPAMLAELRERWIRNEISSRAAGKLLGVSHTTFLAWINEKRL